MLFGLSMDYHVFLLTRIREEYDKTARQHRGGRVRAADDGRDHHRRGDHHGRGLHGFAPGRLGPLQQMGFGLAVAVFMDATIVRTLLVPATMRLLGDRNWYLPVAAVAAEAQRRGPRAERITVPDTPAELVEAGFDSGTRPRELG